MSGDGFLKIRYRIWWIIYFCIHIVFLILMGSTMGKQTWVFSENDKRLVNYDILDDENDLDNYEYDGSKFEGNMNECTESCTENYDWLNEKWCDYRDSLEDNDPYGYDSDYIDQYSSVCKMFANIIVGINFYVIFESVAMISLIVWSIGMICYCRRVNCLPLTFCCSGCTWASHYIAIISFMNISNARSSTDCDEFPDDGTSPKLCYGPGPSLSLVILGFLPIIVILYCVIACCLKKHHGYDGLHVVAYVQPVTMITTQPAVLTQVNYPQPISFVQQPYCMPSAYPQPVYGVHPQGVYYGPVPAGYDQQPYGIPYK